MAANTHEHRTLEFALAPYYKASHGKPSLVTVPEWPFLMLSGQGNPNTSMEYKDAVEALYSVSYTLKFDLRKRLGFEYKVAPLEGLWWTEDMREFDLDRRDLWQWTMMIAQPKELTLTQLEQALDEVWHNKKLPNLERMRLEHLAEGLAAQVLHVGPYASEAPTIVALRDFIHAQGGRFDGLFGKHHEIYLSDPNRTAPEKLKTVIRQPFTPA